MEEIWKHISGFEEYQVSDMGRIKSIKNGIEKILKPFDKGRGYLAVTLNGNPVSKNIMVQQLVAEAFLNHNPSETGLVISHKNNNKNDNRAENLELIINRKNTHIKHSNSSSRYIGVCWNKQKKRWQAQIRINGKIKLLGRFTNEDDAGKAYQDELAKIS